MSITQSLYRYLTDSADLVGHAARLFTSPLNVNGLTVSTRNDARRHLRDQIGRSVYADRRPQDSSGHTAIVLRVLGSDPDYVLAGAETGTVHFVEVDVFARGGDSATRCELIAKLVELCCGGYHGDYWGDEYVGECTIDRDGTAVYEPGDASDAWTHRYTMDLRVLHSAPVPNYPATPLQAVIDFPLAFGEGTSFLMSAAQTIIPEQRTLVDIDWNVTRPSYSTTDFNGPPDMPVTTPNIGGTYRDPAMLRSAFAGMDGGTFTVTLTVTDNDGLTSTAQAEWR